MSIPHLVEGDFSEFYQLCVGYSSEPHPAARQKHFDYEDDAYRFLRNLRVSDTFWRHALSTDYEPGQFSITPERVMQHMAKLCQRGSVKIMHLPNIQDAALTQDKKGWAYSFFPGPNPLPHARETWIVIRNKQHAQEIVAGLSQDETLWRKLLAKNNLLPTPMPTSFKAKERVAEALARGELHAYSFQARSAPTHEKELVYEDIAPHLLRAVSPPDSAPASPPAETLTEPQNLDDAEKRLAQRRRQITQRGYQQKYSDEELQQKAAEGEVNDRFLVRLIFNDPKSAESGTLGFRRESGRAPYWATTLDMAEAADTDPEILAALFGIDSYDPKQEFTLAVIDMEKMPPQAERQSFIPTHKKMAEFGEKEMTEDEGFEPGTMTAIMTEDFGNDYAGFMVDYGMAGGDVYSAKKVAKYSEQSTDNKKKQRLLQARHKMQLEFGANPLYSGNGMTKVDKRSRYANDIGQDYGVVETFTFERDPLTIAELQKMGAVKLIPAKPIRG